MIIILISFLKKLISFIPNYYFIVPKSFCNIIIYDVPCTLFFVLNTIRVHLCNLWFNKKAPLIRSREQVELAVHIRVEH